MPKISQLSALTVPDPGDELAIVDSSASTTKKITRTNLLKGAPLPADTVDTQAIDDDAVTAPKTDFGGDYSTSEVNTGFKWVDGKDIYKKTVNFGALPNSTTKTVAHGITGLLHVLDHKTEAHDSSFMYSAPHANVSATGTQISIYFDATYIYIVTGTNRSSATAYITLFYTKT